MFKTSWPWLIGIILHYLIAAAMIAAGVMKLVVTFPPEAVEKLTKAGLIDDLTLIAYGEIATAVLLILPRTASLGVLLTSSFWGGAILSHMAGNESYAVQSGFLIATWLGAFLRMPAMFCSFSPNLAKEV